MTNNIFEIFNPGDRHWRENKDFEKVHVFTTRRGGRGPMQVDLDDGTIVLPDRPADEGDGRPVRRGARQRADGEQKPTSTATERAAAREERRAAREAARAQEQAEAEASTPPAPAKGGKHAAPRRRHG